MSIKNYSIENTSFTIFVDNTLTDLDRKVLTHCYLPIIGDKALSISIRANNVSNSAVNVDAAKTEVLSTQSVVTPRKHKKSKRKQNS